NQNNWLKTLERFFYNSSGRLASESGRPMPSENFTEESLEDYPRGTMHVLLFLWNEAMAMHMPVQRQSFAPHSIIYFGVTVTAPMKTARLCARCWCWPLGFSGSASLGG